MARDTRLTGAGQPAGWITFHQKWDPLQAACAPQIKTPAQSVCLRPLVCGPLAVGMLLSDLAAVRAAHIILASSSPRRVDMFNNLLKLDARVVPSTFPEDLDKSKFTPVSYVVENAKQKALEVYNRLVSQGEAAPPLVVGADTVVVLDDRILEKPKSSEAAVQMLTSLSGRGHTVCTGVALIYRGAPDAAVCFHESTEVIFGDLSAAAIQEYVDSGEPMDKAGAYGIQGFAGAFVAQIRGCYHNVVGFPMHRFCREVDVERLRP